jgi:hypothetical protein
MTANVTPNAIEIVTSNHSHFVFTSFFSRDPTFALLLAVWQHHRSVGFIDERRMNDEERERDREREDQDELIIYDDDSGIERRHQFISFRSSGSKRYHDHPVREVEDDLLASHPAAEDYENADEQEQGENIEKHVATHYEGEEYNQIALDTVLATSPLKAFDLIFKNEDFMKNFWTCNQKVKGV